MIVLCNFSKRTVEKYFYWIKYLSWLGYSNEVLMVNQWESVRNISCNNLNSTYCRFKNGTDVLNVFGMEKDNFYLNLYLMGALFLSFRVFTYAFLVLKSNRYK
jgi:hypothetical protein